MFKRKTRVIIDVDPEKWVITDITGINLDKEDVRLVCATAVRMLSADDLKKHKRRNA